jgi:hypothetical protein
MIDGTKVLASVSGLSPEVVKGIWAEVQANRARLSGCARHRFDGDWKIGQRKVCLVCGGGMSLTDIGNYIRGYEAAGGNANDIWQDFKGSKAHG